MNLTNSALNGTNTPSERPEIPSGLNERGTPILSINEHHASRVEHLADHHRDPFDRLLIAQAQVENLVILTADPMFARYDVALA
ncbi:type II toxin-antitoxin system VapC family toxin [Aminobacter sp. DSM 101952]|uniref:type II toxin-antitoxin system VapC family toxin n=1 Tax=Aminobacter sp. DSM 101952 TaxID=2735891 RepID=UPI0009EC8460|nr:type II toxin-antitoxin system VapC family toxin [Aminobacter sp. DSM 101952]